MSERGGLVVYVTSHGFGHLNRTVAVLNRIPASIPIAIRCHRNLFDHWRERLNRPADLAHHLSDIGAINPQGDSQTTDGKATLDLAERVHRQCLDRLDEEAEVLRGHAPGAVLCDAPAFPLLAAQRAGAPAYLLANFTWADIYAPHARALSPTAERFVGELRRAYKTALGVFRAAPALAMRYLKPRIEVGMVVSAGKDRGNELRRDLGLGRAEKLVYFYIGRYGQANLAWERIEKLEARGIHFVGFHAAPAGPMANFHAIKPTLWTGADLAASCDAIVAKAGYGTVCEAMAARTPIVYPPRSGFAEHRALDRALKRWGAGVPISSRDFATLNLEKALDRALGIQAGPPPFPTAGAQSVADHLIQTIRKG